VGRFESDRDLKPLTRRERFSRLLLLEKSDSRFFGNRFPTLKSGDPGIVAIGHEHFQVGGSHATKHQSRGLDPKFRYGFRFVMHGANLPKDAPH
jgi:hypothetical protein